MSTDDEVLELLRKQFRFICSMHARPQFQQFLDLLAAALPSEDIAFAFADPEHRPSRLRVRLEPDGELTSGPPPDAPELAEDARHLLLRIDELFERTAGRKATVAEMLAAIARALGKSPQDWFRGIEGQHVVAIEGMG